MKHLLTVPTGASRRFLPALAFALVAALLSPAALAQGAPPASSASNSNEDAGIQTVPAYDPIEPVNRTIFAFNDTLYRWVLRPVSRGYVRVVPAAGRRGVENVFENLGAPVRIVSSTLQGKLDRAGRETGKLAINSVAGLAGVFKVSDRVSALAEVPAEDLGQTFGVWRVGNGPYLVLPFLGPSTLRDAVGAVGDRFLNPLEWDLVEDINGYDWTWNTALTTVGVVQGLPGALAAYDAVSKDSIDPYLALRSGYLQNRSAEIRK
jgi:phospholipid-binding lipoprotein MlaA